jgi:excisionase family DNA binding protein
VRHSSLTRVASGIVFVVVSVGLFLAGYSALLNSLLLGVAVGGLILIVAWLYARFGHEDALIPGEDYLSTREVATLLGVKPTWVSILAAGGKIPHATVKTGRFSREPRFPRKKIDAWMAEKPAAKNVGA